MKYRPEYDKELIGKNLRRCRQAKKLSVEEVREYLRLGSLQAIYKWEEGKCYPQTDTMFALMELYGIGLQELLQEENKDVQMEDGNICDMSPHFDKQQSFTENERERKSRRLIMYFELLNRGIA